MNANTKRTTVEISGELREIADRLAGVRQNLQLIAEYGGSNAGDALYMLAYVVQLANERIGECSGDVSMLGKGGPQ